VGSSTYHAPDFVPDVFDVPSNPSEVPLNSPGDSNPARDMPEYLDDAGASITATQTELNAHKGAADPHAQYQKESEKGAAGGYASLDGGGTVPDAQLPATITRDGELAASIAALVNSAPATLDTLNELATALGDDPNFATTTATALGTKATDALVVHKAGAEVVTGAKEFQATVTLTDVNLALSTVTGTKIGTAVNQKLGFFNAAPVVQPVGNSDVLGSLVTLGLRAASANPPLNLGTGRIDAGIVACTTLAASAASNITAPAAGALTVIMTNAASGPLVYQVACRNSAPGGYGAGIALQGQATDATTQFQASIEAEGDGAWTNAGTATSHLKFAVNNGAGLVECFRFNPNGDMKPADGRNMVLGTATGHKIGTAVNQKLGFFNAAPVVQQALAAAAVDAATTQALANSLRAALIALGLGA
jgi:hypothetical protein